MIYEDDTLTIIRKLFLQTKSNPLFLSAWAHLLSDDNTHEKIHIPSGEDSH